MEYSTTVSRPMSERTVHVNHYSSSSSTSGKVGIAFNGMQQGLYNNRSSVLKLGESLRQAVQESRSAEALEILRQPNAKLIIEADMHAALDSAISKSNLKVALEILRLPNVKLIWGINLGDSLNLAIARDLPEVALEMLKLPKAKSIPEEELEQVLDLATSKELPKVAEEIRKLL